MDSLSYYGEDMNEIRISVEKKGSGMMRIKMEDRQNERYEGQLLMNEITNPNVCQFFSNLDTFMHQLFI